MFWHRPTAPKPLTLWYEDMPTVLRLRDLVNDPAWNEAVAVLLAAAQPNFASAVGATTTTESRALRQAWLAGYNDAFKDIHALTRPPKRIGELPPEWSHYGDE